MKRISLLILALLTIISVGSYLWASCNYFRIGFPLDDAWIHQTYARNIASSGEWAFLPGQPSGGSTSPLWTLILSIGYLVHIPHFAWTFFLGIVTLWCTALLVELIIRQHVDFYNPTFPWVGGLIIFEWHLVWASISGMETLLFSLSVLSVFYSLLKNDPAYLKIGILIGIGAYIRPEAVTLLGPACLVAGLQKLAIGKRIENILKISIGFLGLFSLYLLFMHALSGTPWPTTFYAKQAEYAADTGSPILERFGMLFLQLLVGIGILLLPGFILATKEALFKKNWKFMAVFIWVIGSVGLYSLRLPEGYQHGRYLIPSMLIYFVISLVEMVRFLGDLNNNWRRRLGLTWIISSGIVLFCFWGYGAFIYANDVAFIESEMVNTAKWVAQNIPEQDKIAAHDIGALGYFGDHSIIDLAGLISPEVIPFINNETRLKEFLDSSDVKYLISFPGWYPQLERGLQIVFNTQGQFASTLGGENLIVYKWSDIPQK